MSKLKTLIGGLVLAAILAPVGASAMDDWPAKPVRIIVPYGAGGAADTLARTVAEQLSQTMGEQFIVENVTGAGGIIALSQLAKADPDGYTFGINNISTTVIAPVINPVVSYDPLEDFTYVALLGGSPTVWTVNPELGVSTVDELKAYIENSDGTVSYGSPGTGTLSHLIAAKYWSDEGVDAQHVPYKGAGAAFMDVIAGHLPFASGTLSTAKNNIDANQMIPIVVSLPQRDPEYPDVATFAELGHPELSSTTWFGFVGPAGVNEEIVDKLNAEINRVLDLPEVKQRLEPQGLTGDRLTAAEYRQYQIDQTAIFGPIAKAVAGE